MLHQFSNHKEKKQRTITSPIAIVNSETATSSSMSLEDRFSALSLETSSCSSTSSEQSSTLSSSLDSYFSRPVSPAVDSRHLLLPSSLPPRYSPSIAHYIPSRGKPTGFITLKKSFYKELEIESICPKHYLDSKDRERFLITNENGFFYNATGQLLEGPVLYVLFPDNRMYGGSPAQVHHHSYVSRGIDLKAAGIAYFQCGQLITLSNESGHYKPKFEEMQPALEWFLRCTPNRQFMFEDHSRQNPKKQFNGIHFYNVHSSQSAEENTTVELIAKKSLMAIVSELKTAATERYTNSYKSRYTEYSENSSDYEEIYYSEESIAPSTYTTNVSALSAPQSIFDCPDLLSLTCLQRIKEGKASRFNGQLRLRRTF